MEVILANGPFGRVRTLADRIQAWGEGGENREVLAAGPWHIDNCLAT